MLKVKLSKIVAYANRDINIVSKAVAEFFKETEIFPAMENFEKILALFNEWLIFDFKLDSGVNVISDYYFKNPDNLSKDLLEELRQIIETQHLEMLELITLKRGEWLKAYGLYRLTKSMTIWALYLLLILELFGVGLPKLMVVGN